MRKTNNRKNNFKIIILLCAVLVFATILVWHTVLVTQKQKQLKVVFLNVGQGDSIFIESPSGNQMLIDGGKGLAVLRELGKNMSFFDRSIDIVLATHPDMDHIGGLPDVFERYNIGMFIDSGVLDDGEDNKALLKSVKKEGLTPIHARVGMVLDLGGGVNVNILFPDRDVSGVDPNVGSVVIKLTYGNVSMLLTGDSPTSIEEYLVFIYGNYLKSDVLKLGHHGSKTSSSEIFLKRVSPELAIISAGCDNRYGHPHKQVIDLLNKLKIKKLSTCENGSIVLNSDGKRIYYK